jgi:protein-disulfide isomerase
MVPLAGADQIHLPLRMHRFAVVSGNALGCARDQGAGEAFRRLVFSQQDSLGLKDFREFASEVGIEDQSEFERCISAPTDRARVTEGRGLAVDMGLSGTPAVFVNQWQLAQPPSSSELRAMIIRVREGSSPVKGATP